MKSPHRVLVVSRGTVCASLLPGLLKYRALPSPMMPHPPPIFPPLRLCQRGLSFPSKPSISSVGLATDGTQLSCSTIEYKRKPEGIVDRWKTLSILLLSISTFSLLYLYLYLWIPYHRSRLQRCNLHVPRSGLDKAQKCRRHPGRKAEHLCTCCSPGTSGTWFYCENEGKGIRERDKCRHLYLPVFNK